MIVACPHCGKKNRISYEYLGKVGACGRCKTALPPPWTPVDVSREAGFACLIGASLPVLMDFWAPCCGPCRVVAPDMERVDTEALPSLGQRYQVQALPTMALFAGGREIRASGPGHRSLCPGYCGLACA